MALKKCLEVSHSGHGLVINIYVARAKDHGAQVVNRITGNFTENSTTDTNVESVSF